MDFEENRLNRETRTLKALGKIERLRFLNEIDALRLRSENLTDSSPDIKTCAETIPIPTQNVQYTSADGFFNRKRGRPPKNRFVQVYKNVQPDRTPQAVFTSFKLEKQGVLPTANTKEAHAAISQLEIEEIESRKVPIHDNEPIQMEKCGFGAFAALERRTQFEDFQRKNMAQEQKLVRSAGTFFPTHNTDGLCKSLPLPRLPVANDQRSKEILQEMPEDLSVRRTSNEKSTTELLSPESLTNSYLQMFHLLNLYRQTQQLPDLWRLNNYNTSQEPTVLPTQTSITINNAINDASLRLSASEKPMPFGYSRYRYSEDCGLHRCGYRMRQTHFHCDRNDCQYSFCDRARFFQHTARHKRLDGLLATDFKHFRPNVDCNYATCVQTVNSSKKSSSHFHCLKCSFVCYETNKFESHRRLHNKLSSFKKAGFRKVLSKENCVIGCAYNKKQTHYHCSTCDLSVVSKAQFLGHKHR